MLYLEQQAVQQSRVGSPWTWTQISLNHMQRVQQQQQKQQQQQRRWQKERVGQVLVGSSRSSSPQRMQEWELQGKLAQMVQQQQQRVQFLWRREAWMMSCGMQLKLQVLISRS
jgi:hypothetical protein